MSALLFFRPLLRDQAARFALSLLLMLVTLAAGAALLGVSGWFLTAAAIATSAATVNLFGMSALVRGLSLVRIVSRYGEKLVGHDATLRLLTDIRGWLFGRLFPRVPLAAATWRRGDLVSRLTADVDALDSAFLSAFAPLLCALALGAGVSAVLFAQVPLAGLLYAAAFALSTLVIPAILVVVSRRSGRDSVEAAAALRTAVLDGIEGHADLIALGATSHAAKAVRISAEQRAASRRRLGIMNAAASLLVQLLSGAAMLGVLWTGIGAFAEGSISAPLLVGLLLASLGSFEASGAVLRSAGRLGGAVAAAERLRDLATAPPQVCDPLHPLALPPGAAIRVEDLTFGYDPRRPALKELSLHVAQGERIAVLGPSGAGKSTLLAMLLRLADPQAGRVRVAGTDIARVPLADLHRRVALLSQDTAVFGDTVRGNLEIARCDASEEELWQALDAARLADTIRALPDGLDTFVGETGRTLSAGQARRLCLARALLSRAPIIALDEPTSGLDEEAERAFLADLGPATQGRTVILVTHAALPAGAVDRVLRLREGRLVQ